MYLVLLVGSSYNYLFLECLSLPAPLPWLTSIWYRRRGTGQATGRTVVPNASSGFERARFRCTNRSTTASLTVVSATLTRGISFRTLSRRVVRSDTAASACSLRTHSARRSPSLSFARSPACSFYTSRSTTLSFVTLRTLSLLSQPPIRLRITPASETLFAPYQRGPPEQFSPLNRSFNRSHLIIANV